MKIKYELSLIIGFALLFLYAMPFIEYVSDTNLGYRLFYGWASIAIFFFLSSMGIKSLSERYLGGENG